MKEMKALILAGGFGTRLRPLSCTRPKLMFPIGNQPILEWTIVKLRKCGVNEVILAVNYMADVLEKYFGCFNNGVKISYSQEVKPLGTGGPIKEAEFQLIEENNGDPFFVLNGDILSNLDYNSLYKAHINSEAEITIALHEIEDPNRFGVVEIDSDNRILRFVEKPPLGSEPSNLINAGVYVVNPSVLDYIPKGQKISIERQIFPKLADLGTLFGYKFEDLWIDIGVPEDYLRANMLVLEEMVNEYPQREIEANIHPKSKIIAPNAISKGVVIGDETSVGPNVSLGKGSSIGRGVRLENSILFNDVIIEDFSLIKSSIIGEHVVLGKKTNINEGCILGDYVRVSDGVTLTSGVQICPYKEVSKSVLEKRIVM